MPTKTLAPLSRMLRAPLYKGSFALLVELTITAIVIGAASAGQAFGPILSQRPAPSSPP